MGFSKALRVDAVAMGWPQFGGVDTIDYVGTLLTSDQDSIEENLEVRRDGDIADIIGHCGAVPQHHHP